MVYFSTSFEEKKYWRSFPARSNLVVPTKMGPFIRTIPFLVDATRFELATSASRTQRFLLLSYARFLIALNLIKTRFQISKGFMYLQTTTHRNVFVFSHPIFFLPRLSFFEVLFATLAEQPTH